MNIVRKKLCKLESKLYERKYPDWNGPSFSSTSGIFGLIKHIIKLLK